MCGGDAAFCQITLTTCYVFCTHRRRAVIKGAIRPDGCCDEERMTLVTGQASGHTEIFHQSPLRITGATGFHRLTWTTGLCDCLRARCGS